MRENYMKLPTLKTVSGKQIERVLDNREREFWSYLTKIASIDNNGKITLYNGNLSYTKKVVLDNKTFGYSRTTVAYLNMFLRTNTKELRELIKIQFIALDKEF